MTLPFRTRRMTSSIGMAIVLALGSSGHAAGQEAAGSKGGGRGLDGTWRVQVTIVDCSTGAERPPFWSLVTFARGGTATDTTANQSFPGQRTAGHGTWGRTGRFTYSASTEAFILFGPALRPWVHRIVQEIEMTGNDEFTSQASVSFSLAPGALPPPPMPLPTTPICATAVGHRF